MVNMCMHILTVLGLEDIIAPRVHAYSGVKRLLCQSVSRSVSQSVQSKCSSVQLSGLGDFVTDMYNASSVILASLYLIKLEVFLFAGISSHFLL